MNARSRQDARPPILRTCVVCRTRRQKDELLRVVRSPDGDIIVDADASSPGRGAYVCRDEACHAGSADGARLSRALRVKVSRDLIEPTTQARATNEGATRTTAIHGGTHGA